MPFSEDTFNRFYYAWMLWRAVDRKPTEFIAALKIPSDMWTFFSQVDPIFDIKERNFIKKQAESTPSTSPSKVLPRAKKNK